ncbi:hypothetical protein G7Y79_00026g059210 [Physcia stellaris]|nr:hypothetical protein G7Y79_00026g059210 [Physcia stellaris]
MPPPMTPIETFNHNSQHMPQTDKDQLRELETLRKTHTHLREEREYNKRKDHAQAHGLPKPAREEVKLDPISVFPPGSSAGLLAEIHQLKVACDYLSNELELRSNGGVRTQQVQQRPSKVSQGLTDADIERYKNYRQQYRK